MEAVKHVGSEKTLRELGTVVREGEELLCAAAGELGAIGSI